jgi:hypothetical protein
MYCKGTSSPQVVNNLFTYIGFDPLAFANKTWAHMTALVGDGTATPTIEYNVFEGITSGFDYYDFGSSSTIVHNTDLNSTEPALPFVGGSTVGSWDAWGTYELISGSPCIAAGKTSVIDMSNPSMNTDFAGVSREYNGTVDIGALEYQ